MKFTTLKEYVELEKAWYDKKYGPDSWQWCDEGLYNAIADYHSSFDFTENDIAYMRTLELEPEDFITIQND